jgi:hypothetical protein
MPFQKKPFHPTKHALIERSGALKETTRYFTKTKVYVVSLVLSLVFKTVFGVFGFLSAICKIRNVWKLLSLFSEIL